MFELIVWWALFCLGQTTTTTDAVDIPEHHSLHDALDHFEVLHVSHLSHHPPPHTSHPHNRETTHIHFRTLGRDFNLILTPSLTTLHNSLRVTVVTETGVESRPFPYTHFYTGHLLGSPDSHVTAQLHPKSGVLTASIHTTQEVYYVEPLSRHFPESHDNHMISYKHSHLKFNMTNQKHFCGNHEHELPGKQATSPWEHPQPQTNSLLKSSDHFPSGKVGSKVRGDEKQRAKRGLSGDVCTLHLVATPSFHSQTSTDPDTTALFLLGLISDIDLNIFKSTNFTTNPSTLGLVVTNITIYSSVTPSTPLYATEKEKNSEKLLKIFSETDWSTVCLAHLFTAVDLDDSRLGVAYVAGRNKGDTGGICSPLLTGSNGKIETSNVGMSTFRSSGNRPLLFAEARLVTAHEIGHGWGSEHDPTGDARCSPSLGRNEGKFLMFPSATDADQRNNDKFSPCSVAMMSDVVERKGSCFRERSQLEGLCGNYKVEEGEECDAGALGMVNSDPCCTSDCKLRPTTPTGDTVQCSDVNDDCCENCQISNPESQKVCRTNRQGNANCLRSVFCMGEKVCPQNLTFDLKYVTQNSTCGQLGRCLPPDSKCDVDGNCVAWSEPDLFVCYNFCQWHGQKECFCTGSDECKFCCLPTVPGTRNEICAPFDGTSKPDHSSCIGGFCDNGECVPSSQDLIQRLFDLFDNPSLNTFVQFMRENIVGTIVVLTALIWVPASFFVNIFDVYRWRKHKRVAREFEADLQDAELEDEDDLFFYENVFEGMEQTQPGVLRPEAKLALMRLDSGTFEDYFGSDDVTTPLTPLVPTTTSAPYSGFWEHRLSTITEESGTPMNPERDNIHLYNIRMPRSSSAGEGGGALKRSSLDTDPGTLV